MICVQRLQTRIAWDFTVIESVANSNTRLEYSPGQRLVVLLLDMKQLSRLVSKIAIRYFELWTFSPSMQKWASFCVYFWATKQNMKRRMPLEEVWQVSYTGNRRPSIFYMCCTLCPLWLLHNECTTTPTALLFNGLLHVSIRSSREREMLEMGLIYFIVGDVAGCCSPLLTLVCWIIGS